MQLREALLKNEERKDEAIRMRSLDVFGLTKKIDTEKRTVAVLEAKIGPGRLVMYAVLELVGCDRPDNCIGFHAHGTEVSGGGTINWKATMVHA